MPLRTGTGTLRSGWTLSATATAIRWILRLLIGAPGLDLPLPGWQRPMDGGWNTEYGVLGTYYPVRRNTEHLPSTSSTEYTLWIQPNASHGKTSRTVDTAIVEQGLHSVKCLPGVGITAQYGIVGTQSGVRSQFVCAPYCYEVL